MLSATGVSTGIDLGSRNVKVVRARNDRGSTALTDLFIEELPPTDQDNWEGEATRALGRILKSGKLGKRDMGRVAVAASGAAVHIRQVELPALTDAEIRASLKYEARKHLPLENPSDAAIDCQVMERPGESPKMSVVFAGAPEWLVRSRVRVLERVGLEPDVVDVAPLALLNGLYAQPEYREGNPTTVAILDLGRATTTMTMARRNGVVYSRTVSVAGPGDGAVPEADSEETAKYAGAVAAAFRETAQFYATLNVRRSIEVVYLAGGNALLPGLPQKLAGHLGVTVSPLDLTRGLHYSPRSSRYLSPEALQAVAPQFAVALGLIYWGNGDV